MRFYAVCLASYNAGILHSAWIDVSTDVDEMQAAIDEMLRRSPQPNVTLQDYVDDDGKTHSIDVQSPADPAWTKQGEPYASAEEWAVHDYDGAHPFGSNESPSLQSLADWAGFLELAEDRGIPEAVAAELAERFGWPQYADSARAALEDNYQGVYESLEDWAYRFEEDAGGLSEVPERLQNYIDFAAIGRDAKLSGDILEIQHDGESFIFWNH